nr:uncharacterized protein LOC112426618 [Macaca nemestrina]
MNSGSALAWSQEDARKVPGQSRGVGARAGMFPGIPSPRRTRKDAQSNCRRPQASTRKRGLRAEGSGSPGSCSAPGPPRPGSPPPSKAHPGAAAANTHRRQALVGRQRTGVSRPRGPRPCAPLEAHWLGPRTRFHGLQIAREGFAPGPPNPSGSWTPEGLAAGAPVPSATLQSQAPGLGPSSQFTDEETEARDKLHQCLATRAAWNSRAIFLILSKRDTDQPRGVGEMAEPKTTLTKRHSSPKALSPHA